MVRSGIARYSNCTGVFLLQLCMFLLQLHILFSQQVKVLLEFGHLAWESREWGGGGRGSRSMAIHGMIELRGMQFFIKIAFNGPQFELNSLDPLEAAIA